MFDLDPQTSDDFWDAYLAVFDEPVMSDDELELLSDEVDSWRDEEDYVLPVLPFSDGLGFDWPDMSDEDRTAEAPF